jgi:predicted ester cyclase
LVALQTLRGTHEGLFMRNPPTSKVMRTQGIIFANLKDRKILANWMLIDQFRLFHQLGFIPLLD